MAIRFQAPQAIIDQVMDRLRRQGTVSPDAIFNAQAENGLRREVTYRDCDFIEEVASRRNESVVADAALGLLKDRSLVPADADYDRDAFERYRKTIADTFTNPFAGPLKNPELTGTTVTRMMGRLMYMLTSVRRPAHLLELGSFWGNTLAWFAGPCVGPEPLYQAERIIGIDMDAEMTQVARDNFARLPNSQCVELIAEDARTALDRIPGPFDALYLEAKGPAGPKGIEVFYLVLLQQIYDKLPKGAWVLAHDVTYPGLRNQMKDYLAFVRDKSYFHESICFDIDWYGLELSIK